MRWRWREFKRWLGGIRHGATYKEALEKIVAQDDAMKGHEAEWALDLARNALFENDASTDRPTPKLREAFSFYKQYLR